jgi:RNA ligase (TIGR02306 family)
MPSPLRIPVAMISQIAPHPNADSLDVAQVLGWQVVVGRNQFADGDKVVLFPPDTILPRELSDAWGVTQYLDRGRIRATKLRGQPSFGLVMPAHIPEWNVGDDVAADFPGVAKWEPPVREVKQRRQGQHGQTPRPLYPNELPRHALFPEYTHIENLRNFPNLFDPGEIVVVTEKLHGTNSRIGIVDGERMAGSHKVRRGEGDTLYWSPWSQPGVEAMLAALAKHHKQVVLYGEILGANVQSLNYGYKGHEGYRAFDLMINGKYIDFMTFTVLCGWYGVSAVPLLAFCNFFSLEKIRHHAQGKTLLLPDDDDEVSTHIREGIVVKPLIERCDPHIGRVVAKYVSDDYLCMRKSDYAEV